MEFVVYKSEEDNTGRLVELLYNRHCEHYEVVVNGLTEFNSQRYEQANYEFEMEKDKLITPKFVGSWTVHRRASTWRFSTRTAPCPTPTLGPTPLLTFVARASPGTT